MSIAALGIAAIFLTSGSAGGVKWTEFGATKTAWYSAHTPDSNPKLQNGCCFLPRQRDGADRYAAVMYQKYGRISRVFGFEMYFAPAISVASAKAVVRKEAPPGSRLAFSAKRRNCLVIEYKSVRLSRAFRSKLAKMSVGLYSSAGGRFNGRTVDNIIFLPVSSTSC